MNFIVKKYLTTASQKRIILLFFGLNHILTMYQKVKIYKIETINK